MRHASELDDRPWLRRLLDGLLVIFAPRRAVTRLAEADFDVTHKRQPELRSALPVQLAEHRATDIARCASGVQRLRSVHVGAIGSVLSAMLAGMAVRHWFFGPDQGARGTIALASVALFAWATLARLGWAGQTIKGDTSIERIDAVWFHALYWLGMLLATVSIL